MVIKKWEVLEADEDKQREITKEYNVSPFLAGVLTARGYNKVSAAQILKPSDYFADPFLLPDMKKAVERIEKAILLNEKIVIYGDYDVDGMTATVIMVKYLKTRNANVSYYIPDREEEGYGLNTEALKKLKEAKTDLIITVDNGIVAVEEAKLAKELGIDLIITDHHTLRDSIPDALAVIDPLREEYNGFAKIAGVCVAFKLIVALERGDFSKAFNAYGALVCIGTIADIMPIISENRYIVEKGVELLQKEQTPGIEALKQSVLVKGNKITTKDISFTIAPRLNAAARLNSINIAIDLLMSEDKQESEHLAEELKQKNQERKQLEKEAFNSALDFLAKNIEEQNRKVIIIDGDNWHPGVLGIVAAKIADKFSKPCIIIGKYDKVAKGSGRSVGEFPLVDALNNVGECFIKYGGHKSAVGFSICLEKIEEFKKKLEDYVENNFLTMPSGKLIIDKEADLNELSIKNISELERLQPFGTGNEEPLFLIKDVKIKQIIPLCGGKYIKLRVLKQEKTMDLLCFSMGVTEFFYKPGENIDAVVSCKVDYYGVIEQTTIKIVDLRPTQFNQNGYFEEKITYENFKRGKITLKTNLCPTRAEIAIVYRCIKKYRNFQDVDSIFLKLQHFNIKYFKFRLILDVLEEFNLILHEKYITINEYAKKCDLKNSKILNLLETC